MNQAMQVPVLIQGLSTKADGSIKIVMETRELGGVDAARLFDLRNREAWAVIAPTEIREEDVKLPTERPDPAVGTKTPSQRLRAVLYLTWKQANVTTDFESFYLIHLERIISQYKERLDQ